jgi:hypothetical protein
MTQINKNIESRICIACLMINSFFLLSYKYFLYLKKPVIVKVNVIKKDIEKNIPALFLLTKGPKALKIVLSKKNFMYSPFGKQTEMTATTPAERENKNNAFVIFL